MIDEFKNGKKEVRRPFSYSFREKQRGRKLETLATTVRKTVRREGENWHLGRPERTRAELWVVWEGIWKF